MLERFISEDVSNLVILTGDMHTYISSYIKKDFSLRSNKAENVIGIELMTPSISSNNLTGIVKSKLESRKHSLVDEDAKDLYSGLCENIEYEQEHMNLDKKPYNFVEKVIERVIRATNHHISRFNSNIYGYMTVIFTDEEIFWQAYSIDRKSESYGKDDKKLLSVQSYRKGSSIKGF